VAAIGARQVPGEQAELALNECPSINNKLLKLLDESGNFRRKNPTISGTL